MTELDVARHSHLVDPQLHVWGWEIPVYLFLGGMAAGVMILTTLLLARPGERSRALRWLPFAAPALVTVGMVALFLDLEHKLFVWRFYLAFRWTSPMSWGAWILLVVYPVSLLVALAALADDQAGWLAGRLGPLGGLVRRARALALPRAEGLRAANLVVGIGLGLYTGVLLSTLGARALWASSVLGPLFLVSGLSTGAALLMLFPVSHDERHALARWDLWAIGAEVVLLLLFLVGLASGPAASQAAAGLLLGGPYTAAFWALVVVTGLGVPALLEVLEGRKVLRATLVAPALVLVGGLALRWIMVAAGQV
ncbi:MAG: polysulfide reductase NrfD [Anaeromyxobacter sp.]|nr:polysulfide reductase NrfD [Anaeromyxobacter sp.]MBL0275972.1 polysulfide reductase NrfD [Anaeromyxobacter sp.]